MNNNDSRLADEISSMGSSWAERKRGAVAPPVVFARPRPAGERGGGDVAGGAAACENEYKSTRQRTRGRISPGQPLQKLPPQMALQGAALTWTGRLSVVYGQIVSANALNEFGGCPQHGALCCAPHGWR